MAKNITKLAVVIIGLLLLIVVHPATAQVNVCPNGTVPAFSPAPGGFAPAGSLICTKPEPQNRWYRDVNNTDIPCGDGVYLDWPTSLGADQLDYPLYISPPLGLDYESTEARVQMYMAANGLAPHDGVVELELRSYAYDGSLLETQSINSNSHTQFPATGYIWYQVETTIPATVNGYFQIDVIRPKFVFSIGYVTLANVMIYDSNNVPAEMCSVPNAFEPTPEPSVTPQLTVTGTPDGPTQTPTPLPQTSPTMTPTLTATPNGTPTPSVTPWPTSAGGTSTPGATSTRYGVSTRPSGVATSTRLPVPTVIAIGDLGLPEIDVPGIVPATPRPDSTPVVIGPITTTTDSVDATGVLSAVQSAELVVAVWNDEVISSTNFIISGTSVSGDGIGLGGITGIGVNLTDMIDNAGPAFALVRAIQWYMPNLWPIVLMVIVIFNVIAVQRIVKFAVAVIGTAIEIIRRIWDAIPLKSS